MGIPDIENNGSEKGQRKRKYDESFCTNQHNYEDWTMLNNNKSGVKGNRELVNNGGNFKETSNRERKSEKETFDDNECFYIDLNRMKDNGMSDKINNGYAKYCVKNHVDTIKQEIDIVDNGIKPECIGNTRFKIGKKKLKHHKTVSNDQNLYTNLNILNDGNMEDKLIKSNTDYCNGEEMVKKDVQPEGGQMEFNNFSDMISKKRHKVNKHDKPFGDQKLNTTDFDNLNDKSMAKELYDSEVDDYVEHLLENIKQDMQLIDNKFRNLSKKRKPKQEENNIDNSVTETKYDIGSGTFQRKNKNKNYNEKDCNSDSLINQENPEKINNDLITEVTNLQLKKTKKNELYNGNIRNGDTFYSREISDETDDKYDKEAITLQTKIKKKKKKELSHKTICNGSPVANSQNIFDETGKSTEKINFQKTTKKRKNKELFNENFYNGDLEVFNNQNISNEIDTVNLTRKSKKKKKNEALAYQNIFNDDISHNQEVHYEKDAIKINKKVKMKKTKEPSNEIVFDSDPVINNHEFGDKIDNEFDFGAMNLQRRNKKKKNKELPNENGFNNDPVINDHNISDQRRYKKKKYKKLSTENISNNDPIINIQDISNEIDNNYFQRKIKKKKKNKELSNEIFYNNDQVINNQDISSGEDSKYVADGIKIESKHKKKKNREMSYENMGNHGLLINNQEISSEINNKHDIETFNVKKKGTKKKKKKQTFMENVCNDEQVLSKKREVSDEIDINISNDSLSTTSTTLNSIEDRLDKNAGNVEEKRINKSLEHSTEHKNDTKTEFDQKLSNNFSHEPTSGTDSTWQFDDEYEIALEKEVVKWQKREMSGSFFASPLHSILTRTTYPTKEQMEEIRMQNLEVKNGPFTKEEDKTILHNLESFCEQYGLKMYPELFISFPRGVSLHKKVEFLHYLSQGLDNRLIHKVHNRLKILLTKEKVKLGRFSSKEDRKILKYIRKSKSSCPFSDLSKILGRTKDSIFKRYRRLLVKERVTIHWTPERIKPFLQNLLSITKCSNIKDLEHRKIEFKEWKKLSKKMDSIPVIKLQIAWENTIYPRLFVNEDVDMRDVKARIIKRLIKRNETDWRAVNWKKITKKFPGFSSHKIYMMFKRLVIFHVPKEMQPNLKECLTFLKDKLLAFDGIPTTHPFKKIDLDDIESGRC